VKTLSLSILLFLATAVELNGQTNDLHLDRLAPLVDAFPIKDLVVDPSGKIHVLFVKHDPTDNKKYLVSTTMASGVFGSEEVLTWYPADNDRPRIILRPSNKTAVITEYSLHKKLIGLNSTGKIEYSVDRFGASPSYGIVVGFGQTHFISLAGAIVSVNEDGFVVRNKRTHEWTIPLGPGFSIDFLTETTLLAVWSIFESTPSSNQKTRLHDRIGYAIIDTTLKIIVPPTTIMLEKESEATVPIGDLVITQAIGQKNGAFIFATGKDQSNAKILYRIRVDRSGHLGSSKEKSPIGRIPIDGKASGWLWLRLQSFDSVEKSTVYGFDREGNFYEGKTSIKAPMRIKLD